MKQNNILITGASGNIASKVAKALLDLDCNVIVNGRNKERDSICDMKDNNTFPL